MTQKFDAGLWNDDPELKSATRGCYVAVSGNTGAGKSTLIEAIMHRARALNIAAVGVNERALHHPLLRLMFFEPQRYAFGVQLNFLLQRYMLLLRSLNMGLTVVIERSHLDDALFLEQHYEAGAVTAEERDAYMALSLAFGRKIPLPDIFVCLDVKPEVSMQRLARGEETGQRPREFPDESTKDAYVRAWYKRIDDFHGHLSEAHTAGGPLVLRRSAEQDTASLADEVIEVLMSLPEGGPGRGSRAEAE